jgi:hypothetical protein
VDDLHVAVRELDLELQLPRLGIEPRLQLCHCGTVTATANTATATANTATAIVTTATASTVTECINAYMGYWLCL